MRTLLPATLMLLMACGGDVAADMERGIELTNDAIAFGLLASEGVAWVDANDSTYRQIGDAEWGVADAPPGSRHGAAGACPLIERTPVEGTPFSLVANYAGSEGRGCFSGSQLLPSTVAGTLALTVDGADLSMDFTDLRIADVRSPAGTLTGRRKGESTEHYSVSGRLELPETPVYDAIAAKIALTIDHRDIDAVSLDGQVEITRSGEDPVTVLLDRVVLQIADIGGECSVPHKGTSTVENKPEIRVLLDNANDEDRVLVERLGRTSTPTRICSFASDVF